MDIPLLYGTLPYVPEVISLSTVQYSIKNFRKTKQYMTAHQEYDTLPAVYTRGLRKDAIIVGGGCLDW